MKLASTIADHWLRRLILARYSPEFYRWVGLKRFPHPETHHEVLFHSLPPEEQKKIHDEWQQGQSQQQVRMSPKEWGQMLDKATGGHEEAEAARADRREMAKRLKGLKEKKLSPDVFRKEKGRLLQEMESRRLKRKQERQRS